MVAIRRMNVYRPSGESGASLAASAQKAGTMPFPADCPIRAG
jgi:hypothetical protein